MEIDKNKDEILYEKYVEYVKDDVLPRAQSRLLDNLRKEDPELATYALERMRTYEWSKNTRFAYEWYLKNQLDWYWKRTERKIREVKKEMTVLAVTSAAISTICLIIMICMFL